MLMKFVAFISLILIFSCKQIITYPVGGYDYPKSISGNDTNFYDYPIRNFLSKKDSFQHSFSYLFFQPFDEPNLSLRPLAIETFRLTYSTAFGESVIISLQNGEMIIKEGTPAELYETDTSALTQIENYLLRLLNRRYPIDTAGKQPAQKKYLDSMVKLYPQLLDPSYYYNLYKKSYIQKTEKFDYTVRKVKLKENQFNSLIEEINSSGFWKLPYKIECSDYPADGDGFTIEANTQNKYQTVSINSCSSTEIKFKNICQKIFGLAEPDKR
jgi:hypothetical protein